MFKILTICLLLMCMSCTVMSPPINVADAEGFNDIRVELDGEEKVVDHVTIVNGKWYGASEYGNLELMIPTDHKVQPMGAYTWAKVKFMEKSNVLGVLFSADEQQVVVLSEDGVFESCEVQDIKAIVLRNKRNVAGTMAIVGGTAGIILTMQYFGSMADAEPMFTPALLIPAATLAGIGALFGSVPKEHLEIDGSQRKYSSNLELLRSYAMKSKK